MKRPQTPLYDEIMASISSAKRFSAVESVRSDKKKAYYSNTLIVSYGFFCGDPTLRFRLTRSGMSYGVVVFVLNSPNCFIDKHRYNILSSLKCEGTRDALEKVIKEYFKIGVML